LWCQHFQQRIHVAARQSWVGSGTVRGTAVAERGAPQAIGELGLGSAVDHMRALGRRHRHKGRSIDHRRATLLRARRAAAMSSSRPCSLASSVRTSSSR
jgi:hypothetical protein